MRIRVLGPMVVADREDLRTRDRAVLGVLVVRAGSYVTTDELADAIWGDGTPATYRKVVQGAVVRLRRELGDGVITTSASGYRLTIPDADLDAQQFARLVEGAGAAIDEGDPRAAIRLAEDAMRLWRGDPLPELLEWAPARTEAQRLSELRDTAEDVRVEALLLSGRAPDAVLVATGLASATPYREARWGLLARAQYAVGRQADALATIRTLRSTLADDLGIDPAPEISALETAMLRQDPSLEPRSAVASGRWLYSRTGRVVAAVLAVATITGLGVATYQQQQAHRAVQQSTSARDAVEAIRIGEVASRRSNPSVSLALAAEALSLDDSESVRRLALDAFGSFADLLGTGTDPDADWPEESSTATSRDGRTTATAHAAAIQLARNGRPTHRLVTPTDHPTALAFSPDGRYLVAGMSQLGFDPSGSSVLWDVQTGREVARFDSGDGAVRAHVFAADGSSVWSLGDDGVHQWDLTASRALVRTNAGDPVMLRAGDLVLSIRDTSVASWIAHACDLAGRPLTPVEWREYVGERPYAPTCR